jgi:FkbM family methyltransferase
MISRLVKITNNPLTTYLRRRYAMAFEWIYVIYDSKIMYSPDKKVLFVDCGSNIGQGYKWFSKFFNQQNIDFEMFEPNPTLFPYLEEIDDVKNGKVKLNKSGVGIEEAIVKFYGTGESEGGALSKGGSIVKNHNSGRYKASDEKSIDVRIIDFPVYIKKMAGEYDRIVVKMDIEGAEVNLLSKMIADSSVKDIDVLYVEFHSQYQDAETAEITRQLEQSIIRRIKNETNVALRVWH